MREDLELCMSILQMRYYARMAQREDDDPKSLSAQERRAMAEMEKTAGPLPVKVKGMDEFMQAYRRTESSSSSS